MSTHDPVNGSSGTPAEAWTTPLWRSSSSNSARGPSPQRAHGPGVSPSRSTAAAAASTAMPAHADSVGSLPGLLNASPFAPSHGRPNAHDLPFLDANSPAIQSSMPRGRHAPTNSLSTISSLDSQPSVLPFGNDSLAPVQRGRTRAGTMPSRFGPPPPPGAPPFMGIDEHGTWSSINGGPIGIDMTTSMRPSSSFRLFGEAGDTDALGETQETSLAKTLDYLGLSDDQPRSSVLSRERARTDAAMMYMGYHQGGTPSADRFLQPEVTPLASPAAGASVSQGAGAPQPSVNAAAPTSLYQPSAPTAPSLMSRAPGYGRIRSGTVAAMSGPDGRQRTEHELQRAYGMMSSDSLSARVRSNSAHLHAAGSASAPNGVKSDDCNLYISRLSAQISTRLLLRLFEPYGMIEDIFLFPQHGAALVQFEEPRHAEHAAKAGVSFIGAYLMECLGDQTVMPQFSANSTGGTTFNLSSEADANGYVTRVVQVSAMPLGTTQADITHLFNIAGPIEHVATQNGVTQITFERFDDARTALQLDASMPFGGAWPLRVQPVAEENVWPRRQPRTMRVGGSGSIVPSSDKGGVPLPSELTPASAPDMQEAMLRLLHFRHGDDPELRTIDSPVQHTYAPGIPMPADGGRASRRMDHAKYRELRKTLEAHQLSQAEVDQVARDQLDVIVELARNYIGNTVVQRFFEQCSERAKTQMLERLAPHLASIGTHKNGTWAAQKIIDCVRTEEQQDLILKHMQPYVPSLLLDQFGNYVVQCVLRFGFPKADSIMDAMVDRCWEIAQGRFGARSMRTCLEHPTMPRAHIKRIALAIILHCVPLSTSSNGSLLLTWLFESSDMTGICHLIAPRLVPYMSQMCTHKLASGVVLRIMSQTADLESAHLLLHTLFDIPRAQVLEEVLLDPVHGVLLVGRALLSPALDSATQARYAETTAELLQRNDLVHIPAYRRLADQLSAMQQDVTTNGMPLPIHPPPPPGVVFPGVPSQAQP